MSLPVPNAPAVIVIHAALLLALHAQFAAAVTATFPFAAAAVVKLDDVGEIVGVQSELKANVLDRALEILSDGSDGLHDPS